MRERGPLLGLGLVAATLLAAGVWLWREEPPSSLRFALSPQECNTECQRQMTDCILACDGNLACERRCTETGAACVERCRRPADAGVAGSAGRSGGGGSAGGRRP